ncbi:hypothetical protein Btaycd_006400 [Bartonella taylorii]|nr:hypothetical protein Btaycd_006400 [Bartonella taylorii]
MSDNDRKNPHEMKKVHEHHDPLERLTRIFHPYKQNDKTINLLYKLIDQYLIPLKLHLMMTTLIYPF